MTPVCLSSLATPVCPLTRGLCLRKGSGVSGTVLVKDEDMQVTCLY